LNTLQIYIDRYVQLGICESDSEDEKLKKRMLSFLPLIIGVAATLWGLIYIALGHYLSAAIPLTYTFVSIINLWHFFNTKNLLFLQISQLLLVLILPFLLMWSLGGFASGSYVMIWAFFAPIAAMAYTEAKKSYWFAFVGLVFFSAVIDPYLMKAVQPLPQVGVEIFFVLNIVAGFSGIYFLIHYYMQEKEKRAEAILYREHEELLKKSEELAEVNAKLHKIASHDHLTGLNNRYSLLDRLQNTIDRAQQNGHKLALFFIDLDRFKQINDSLGHPIGDQVLVHIAHLLRGHVGKNDLVARLGGDEFVLLVDSVEALHSLSEMASSIIQVVQQVIELEEQELQVTCSIGISIYPDDIESRDIHLGHSDTANLLLRNADAAMYRAKAEGKNNYQFYQLEMTTLAFERMILEKNFRNALQQDQLEVYYQPQIDARSDTIIGMEALVRWIHPEKGLIPPSHFLPLAEEIGLVVLMDRIVMQKAMAQFAQWYEQGLNPGVLSLNLAIKQLEQEDLIYKLSKILEETRCLPKWIELEITEGQIMTNPKKSVEVLEAINGLGIKMSIDDFGTGYSSLAYLKRLPIHKLKIDQSFVRDIPDDENDIAIVKAIIALAESMELELIAEGVETEKQKNFLVENRCHNIQGYLYAKPMNAYAMERMLSAQ